LFLIFSKSNIKEFIALHIIGVELRNIIEMILSGKVKEAAETQQTFYLYLEVGDKMIF